MELCKAMSIYLTIFHLFGNDLMRLIRCLSEVVLGHYLTSERQGRCHKILGEYFLGRWSGKLKPVALPGLSLLLSDRKVPMILSFA